MRAFRSFLALAVVGCGLIRAQDVPPPPKPQESGPSWEATMNFIHEQIEAVGPMNYIAYLHDNKTGNDWTSSYQHLTPKVKAIPATCFIENDVSVKQKFPDGSVLTAAGSPKFLLKSVVQVKVLTREQQMKEADASAGHPEWSARVDPSVFVLRLSTGVMDFETCTNQASGPPTCTHGKEAAKLEFYFFDESMANRVAQAMVHAVELCGGGNKDPF